MPLSLMHGVGREYTLIRLVFCPWIGVWEGLLIRPVPGMGVRKVNRLRLPPLGVWEGRKPHKQEEVAWQLPHPCHLPPLTPHLKDC